jgi:hypothetical protein
MSLSSARSTLTRGASALATAALLVTAPAGMPGPYRSVAYAQPAQSKVAFSPRECEIVNNLLVHEVKNYKAQTGDPESAMSPTLPKSALVFIGLGRKVMACDGPVISWVTRGDKSILDAVLVRLRLQEDKKQIPAGLTRKFESVIAKAAQSASLEPAPPK